jgi:hypothetical protein
MPGERPERLPFIMQGKNRHQKPVTALFQDDGTIRNWAIVIGSDGTRERPVLVEPGRQLASMLYGHTGAAAGRLLIEADNTLRQQAILWDPNAGPAAPIRWRGETAGEATVALYGEDAGGTIDRLVVNPIAITSTPASQAKRVADSVAITNALDDVWDPNDLYGLTAADYIDVELFVSNITAATDGVLENLGVDLADAGAIDSIWAAEVPMPAGEIGKSLGVFRMGGDDVIMAEADANAVLQLHIRIVEEGTALV